MQEANAVALAQKGRREDVQSLKQAAVAEVQELVRQEQQRLQASWQQCQHDADIRIEAANSTASRYGSCLAL